MKAGHVALSDRSPTRLRRSFTVIFLIAPRKLLLICADHNSGYLDKSVEGTLPKYATYKLFGPSASASVRNSLWRYCQESLPPDVSLPFLYCNSSGKIFQYYGEPASATNSCNPLSFVPVSFSLAMWSQEVLEKRQEKRRLMSEFAENKTASSLLTNGFLCCI